MFGIGVPELVLILIIGLVVFGPGKLPEIGKSVGRSLNEFKRATSGLTSTTTDSTPTTTVAAAKETQPAQTVQAVQPAPPAQPQAAVEAKPAEAKTEEKK